MKHLINLVKIYQVSKAMLKKVGTIKDDIKQKAIMRKSAWVMKRFVMRRVRQNGRTMGQRQLREIQR